MDNSKVSSNILLTIAATISLTSGLLDVIIGLTSANSEFLLFRSILLPLSITTVVAFISFLILWFVIGKNTYKTLKLDPVALAISFGLFIISSIVLISFNYNSILISSFTSLIFKLAMISAISIAVLIIAYYATKRIQESNSAKHIGNSLSPLIALLLLELVLFIWFGKSETLSNFKASLGFVLIAILTAFSCFKFSGRYLKNVALFLFFIIMIGSPVGFSFSAGIFGQKNDGFEESSANEIKNIILISIDTLRTDVLSSYGSTEVLTPNMDRLSIDGVLFTNAYSPAPWTLPAFSSIMTGVNPLVHKTINSKSKLPDAFTTIAEYTRDNGYRTSAIGKNVFLNSEYNIDQGFMEYNFFPKRKELVDSFGGAVIKIALPDKFKTDASTSDLTELSIKWLKEHQDQDFFLWIHYFDPHIPYTPPEKYIAKGDAIRTGVGNNFMSAGVIRSGHYSPTKADRKRIRQLYDAEVRYVDDNIGKVLDTLQQLDLYKDSLIILTSDHGEEFWDHGGFEHGHTLYNELIHVPLIIKLPENEKTEDIEFAVTTQSILPTILDLTGIEHDNDNYLASSLVPLLKNQPSNYELKPIISSSLLYYEDRESALFDENKYIRTIITEQEELYNLKNDPGEQAPLSNSMASDKINEAKNILKVHKDESRTSSAFFGVETSEKVELDEEKKEKLKALDYIQ